MFKAILFTFLLVFAASAQTPENLFQKQCGTCHNPGNTIGAPLPETLRQMTWKSIVAALEKGKMKGVGDTLTPTERETIAKFLGINDLPTQAAVAMCKEAPGKSTGADWNGWSDAASTRFQTARAAGLSRDAVPGLKLRWAFGFPGVTSAFGAPSVYGGRVLVGDANGVVYSLNARSGCTYWSFEAAAGVRAAPVTDGTSVYFGDLGGNVYALRLDTGGLRWKTRADTHPMAVITGSPKLVEGRLYVPVSGRDESIAATKAAYECCTFRGSVVSLDAATGRKVWQSYTITEEPRVTGKNAKGTTTWGPSGAVPWSSPTIDPLKRVVYIGTGVNYSQPVTETSDAVLAFAMDSGKLLWSKQLTAADAYNFACVGDDKTNCPRVPFVDVDFGNSGVLGTLKGGRRVLAIADKGGTLYGVDPDQEGKLLWKHKVAAGGLNGGFMWGGAADPEGIAYFGISDFTNGKPEVGGGLIAIQLATGETVWQTPAPKPACLTQPGCSAAQSAPVSLIPGTAFLGSWDGHLRAYDTRKGNIIWDFDAVREFTTVNGVPAHGGSMNSMAPAIAGGMLFMTAGYSGTALPGNVLLAFGPDGKSGSK